LVFITASGLLFGSDRDIQIRAWDSDTSVQLWASRLGSKIVGSPVMYEMAGRQYLLFPAVARRREALALVRGRRSGWIRQRSGARPARRTRQGLQGRGSDRIAAT
jgi:hypothetical protein